MYIAEIASPAQTVWVKHEDWDVVLAFVKEAYERIQRAYPHAAVGYVIYAAQASVKADLPPKEW